MTPPKLRSELEPILEVMLRMHAEGASEDAVRERLASMGLRDAGTREVLAAFRARVARQRRRKGMRNLAIGGLILLGGVVAMTLTFDAATRTEPASLAAYGIIGAGLIQSVFGARQLSG